MIICQNQINLIGMQTYMYTYLQREIWKVLQYMYIRLKVRVMVFNTTFTFNNISVISWWSLLLVEETREPRENHWPVASHR